MRIIPFLGFHGQAHEAMAFYATALGGKVVGETRYSEMPTEGNDREGCGQVSAETADYIAHSQLEVGSAVLMAADGPTDAEGGGTTTVNVEVDSIEEAERVFAALAAGGKVDMPMSETFWAYRWGYLHDRYGKPWMVNCMKPDPVAAGA